MTDRNLPGSSDPDVYVSTYGVRGVQELCQEDKTEYPGFSLDSTSFPNCRRMSGERSETVEHLAANLLTLP